MLHTNLAEERGVTHVASVPPPTGIAASTGPDELLDQQPICMGGSLAHPPMKDPPMKGPTASIGRTSPRTGASVRENGRTTKYWAKDCDVTMHLRERRLFASASMQASCRARFTI
jgi:hypothetical protein